MSLNDWDRKSPLNQVVMLFKPIQNLSIIACFVFQAKFYYRQAAAQGHIGASQRLGRLTVTESASKMFQDLSSAQQQLKCKQLKTRAEP